MLLEKPAMSTFTLGICIAMEIAPLDQVLVSTAIIMDWGGLL